MSDSQHWNARGVPFVKETEDRLKYQAWSKITIHATPPSSVVDPHYIDVDPGFYLIRILAFKKRLITIKNLSNRLH
jgi:hypothetical protein